MQKESEDQKSHRSSFKTGRNSLQGSNEIQIFDHLSLCRRYCQCESVLSVLGACVKCGDEIELECEGEDEELALETLVKAIESGLGE